MGLNVLNSKNEFDSKRNLELNVVDKKSLIDIFFSKIEIKPLTTEEVNKSRMKAYNPIC